MLPDVPKAERANYWYALMAAMAEMHNVDFKVGTSILFYNPILNDTVTVNTRRLVCKTMALTRVILSAKRVLSPRSFYPGLRADAKQT